MTPSQIFSALHTLLSAHQPVFLWAHRAWAKARLWPKSLRIAAWALRDIRAVLLDPVDLRGLPRLENGRAEWCPPAFLPGPDDSEQGIIFLDELNAAPPIGSGRLLPACTGQANRGIPSARRLEYHSGGQPRKGQGRYPPDAFRTGEPHGAP